MTDNELRHRMTATEFANRQLNEIERLRELVKQAYHEGFTLGRRVGRSIRSQRTPSRAWDDSVAKRELAGAISSRSEELDK